MIRALLLTAVTTAVLTASATTAPGPVAYVASMAVDGSDVRVLSGAEPAFGPVSARGGRILFFRGGPEYLDLWAMNGDGSGARRLVEKATEGYGPATWSPTGNAIATTGWDDSTCLPTSRNCAVAQVRVHDPETGEIAARLPTTSRGAYTYSWAPDGRRIAYLGALDMDLVPHTVETVAADGTGRRVLVRRGDFSEIAWSPRGDRIAYVQKGWIWLVRASSGKPERVAKGMRLLWSPRGQLLYSASDGRRLLDPATKRSRLLLRAPAYVAAWSPDGTRLAYRAAYAGGVTTLAVVRASDGRVLSRPRVTGKVTSLDFAAGGTRLLYSVRFD